MDVAQVIAEMQAHLHELPPHHCPITPDNWAALADMTYNEFRNVVRKTVPKFFETYTDARLKYRKDLTAALLRLKKPTKQNLQPVMKKFDISLVQARGLCKRLKHYCPPRTAVLAAKVANALQAGMTFEELAQASGMTRAQVVNAVYREVRRGKMRLDKQVRPNTLGAKVNMTIVRKVNHDS